MPRHQHSLPFHRHTTASWLLFAVFLMLLATRTHAVNLPLQPEADAVPELQGLAWYRDASSSLTADDVAHLDQQDLFSAGQPPQSLGYTKDVLWLRFTVTNHFSRHRFWLLDIAPAFLDHVELFQTSDQEPFSLGAQGDHTPWQGRLIPWRNSLFVLSLPAESSATYYLRVQSSSALVVIPVLRNAPDFLSTSSKEMLVYGALICTSILLVMLSIFFYVTLREKIYLWLTLYITSFSFIATQIEGVIHFLALPVSSLQLEWVQIVLQGIGMLSMTLVFREITELKTHFPRFSRILTRSTILLSIIGMVPMAAGHYSLSISAYWIMMMAICVMIPITTLALHRKLGSIAWLYTIAFAVISYAYLTRFLWVFGAIDETFVSRNNFSFVLLIHVLVLFLTVAARYVKLERNIRKTEQLALENIRRSEKQLETLVQTRTAELDQANKELTQALEFEKHAMLEQRNFLRMVAHEFRTPLSVISMAADLISSDPRTPERHATVNCSRIQQATDRLAALTNQALREDKFETSAWRLNAEFVSTSELLEGGKSYGQMISAGSRHFVISEQQPLTIQGDRELLVTLINNVIDNAVKYSPSDSTIFLESESTSDKSTCIRIRDSGHGMNDNEREMALHKYFRANRAHGIPGMGLGLYLVDRIARLHNATLSIDSEPDRGTTLTLLFSTVTAHEESRE